MDFHRLLRDYVNNGCLSPADHLLSVVAPGSVFKKNAKRVSAAFGSYTADTSGNGSQLVMPPYSGDDPSLNGLREFLKPVAHAFYSVVLHGSQADGNTTPYSDVDALVVLKDGLLSDEGKLADVARRLSQSRRFMHRIDPLQHHGWFVMTQRDLIAYPTGVLPVSALQDAKVLLGEGTWSVHIPPTESSNYRDSAIRLMTSLALRITDGWRPVNGYQLKSFLSECMMLPVSYLQARDGKGWSKRDSFKAAAADFIASDWKVIETLTAIRSSWSYVPSWPASAVYRSSSPISAQLRKRWPSAIPASLSKGVPPEFYMEVLTLIDRMRKRLDHQASSKVHF